MWAEGAEDVRKTMARLLRGEHAREVRLQMLGLQMSRAAIYRWHQQGRVMPVVKARDFPLLTAQQVAEELQVRPATVYKWAAAGRLPSVHVGRCLRFRLRDLAAFAVEVEVGDATEEAKGARLDRGPSRGR